MVLGLADRVDEQEANRVFQRPADLQSSEK
jgi:hypothetical protein